MSREIRRVTPDWQHPVTYERPMPWLRPDSTHYLARGCLRYKALLNPDDFETYVWYTIENASLYGPLPDPADFMLYGVPLSERTHYQVYETVSEGTPVSPVFATEAEIVEFLVTEGEWYSERKYTRPSAEMLVRNGSSFGSLFSDTRTGMIAGPENMAEALEASAQART